MFVVRFSDLRGGTKMFWSKQKLQRGFKLFCHLYLDKNSDKNESKVWILHAIAKVLQDAAKYQPQSNLESLKFACGIISNRNFQESVAFHNIITVTIILTLLYYNK